MRGVWTAVITPFTQSNEIDFEAYRKILKDQKAAGISGVIPCGTTGEAPTLTLAEKKKLIQVTLEELKSSSVKVFAGTGSNNTAETIELSRWAADQGVDGVLIVAPYYNKPSQAGMEAHFKAVADSIACEVMLYNVPGRSVVSLAPDTIARLAKHPRIRTIKEATGNVAFTSEIMDSLSVHNLEMDILSGDDATYLPLMSVGAVGVVSVASNLFPRAMVAIQKAMEAGQLSEARAIHQRYYPLFRDLFLDANPVPIKAAMKYAGWGEDHVRSPLVAMSEPVAKKLLETLKRCGISSGKPL